MKIAVKALVFLAAAVALATTLLSCAGMPPAGHIMQPGAWTGDPAVTTRFGIVGGVEDADGTFLWRAIPFAKPPVGGLRWRAPQDPDPWSGVRSPRSFNGGCTQLNPLKLSGIGGSEDCLYLNVWRPRDAGTRLPVYVWIHGGGNSIGSATEVPDYYGNKVASRAHMVFVSMNYRLGPFGWFTTPALRDGATPLDASGNYGTLDIVKSLQWIHDNIEAFGGDPSNVTITGESAGAFDVLSLLIATPAAGLFQRAISESGSARTSGVEEADARARGVIDQLLVKAGRAHSLSEADSLASSMSSADLSAFLRSRTDRQIMRCYAAGSLMGGMVSNPALIRDGTVLPADGFDALSSGAYPNKVPVILGTNKEEVKLFMAFAGTISWKSDLYAAIARYESERWKVSGVDEVARRLAASPGQPPVYAYRFDWGAPDEQGASPLPGNWGKRLGAFHSSDVPFFLGTDTVDGALQMLLYTKRNEPGRKALSGAMMDYAEQFAATGNPNKAGSPLPEWKPWTNVPDAEKLIVFNVKGDTPAINMTSTELTDDSVFAEARNLAEPLRTQVLAELGKSYLPAGVH